MRSQQQLPARWALALAVLAMAAGGLAAPPKNVYLTPAGYTAAYHYLTCATSAQETPADTAAVAAVVARYYKQAVAGAPVTLRTSRPRFHSTATFVCPVPDAPVAATATRVATEAGRRALEVGLLQNKLNKVLAVDAAKATMRVGAGMTITELLREATKAKLSVQIGSLPAYAGLTLGGVLATSAHGSGDKTINSLADTVLEVTWVDGTGKVHVSKPSDPEFKAFNGGIGLFGVMTELLIQLTPPTLTELITVKLSDKNLMQDIERLLKVSPHILIHWRPDSGEFKAFLTREAARGAKATPKTSMTVLPSLVGQPNIQSAFRVWHTTTDDDSDMMGFICPQVTEQSLSAAWGSVNGERVDNVTAPTNDLISAECDETCLWNDRSVVNGTAMDAEFTIDYSQLASWINDVKRIFNVELKENGKADYRCMGLGYMWIRFGRDFNGLTATPAGIARPVYVQSTWMRSRAEPHYSMRFQFVVDLVEELTLCKYKGRPHWGKNFDRTFTHPRCPVAPMYPKFSGLVQLAKKYDPAGMFKPRLFDKMVAKSSFELAPGCSALMRCFCQADAHCHPGMKCVKSIAFPDYRVCKAPMPDKKGSILPLMLEGM